MFTKFVLGENGVGEWFRNSLGDLINARFGIM